MKVGDRVKVKHNSGYSFSGCGTIKEIRPGSYPYRVEVPTYPGQTWPCAEDELELVEEPMNKMRFGYASLKQVGNHVVINTMEPITDAVFDTLDEAVSYLRDVTESTCDTTIAYKVVRKEDNGTYTSCYARGDWSTLYCPGVTVRAKLGKLFVFRDEHSARKPVSRGHDRQLWKCEVTNPQMVKRMAEWPEEWEPFWKKGELPTLNTFYPPAGTLVVDTVKLTERIQW